MKMSAEIVKESMYISELNKNREEILKSYKEEIYIQIRIRKLQNELREILKVRRQREKAIYRDIEFISEKKGIIVNNKFDDVEKELSKIMNKSKVIT